MTDETDKKQRVKARWALLFKALNGSASIDDDNNEGTDSYSMNSFPGFGVLQRTVVDDNECKQYRSYATADEIGEWNIIQNSYTTANNSVIQFYTREVKKQSQQMKREALFSHRKYGVDNTGNVRVWDAESTLAGFLLDMILDEGEDRVNIIEHGIDSSLEDRAAHVVNLSSLKDSLHSVLLNGNDDGRKSCNILELGAGQAGLAGLALVSSSCSLGNTGETATKLKELHLTLTDGHPNCVKNNAVCAQMMSDNYTHNTFFIDTQLLLWDSSQKGFESCKQMQESFDICLASDCVHFQEFHDGLFMTIGRTLAVNGIALLCQPKRGDSLNNFMSLVNHVNGGIHGSEPLFEIILLENFHPKVSRMHNFLTSEKDGTSALYNPNWHRPLLLYLKKLRPYVEETDGSLARNYVSTYKSNKEKEPEKETNKLAPYNPTHSTAQSKALELLSLKSNDVLFDLGCGDGRLLVRALEGAFREDSAYMNLRCVGIEYDQVLAESAKANIQKILTGFDCDESSSTRACIRWDDVLNQKERGKVQCECTSAKQLTLLNDATAVFVYLLPDGLRKIKPLLREAAKRRRMQRQLDESIPPFRIVSYIFSIPDWKKTAVDNSSKGGCALNYYENVDLLD